MFKKIAILGISIIIGTASTDIFAVGGSVTDTELKNVVCKNVTTGQSVTIKRMKGADFWDCTAAGLLSRAGDTIKETLTGTITVNNEWVQQPGPGTCHDSVWGTKLAQNGDQSTFEALFDGGWNDFYYDYFQFDVTQGPLAANTLQATVTFWFDTTMYDPAFQIFRVTQPWTEAELSFAKHPESVFVKDFGKSITQSGFYTVDITEIYKGWKNGEFNNYGIMLSPTKNNNTNGTVAACENRDSTHRPKLTVKIK